MNHDEQRIRELIAAWMQATAAGDVPQLLNLVDEDVVFIIPGQPLMRGREAYATELRTLFDTHRVEASSDIQEIAISGGLAYCWNYLLVTVTPLQEGVAVRRSGYTLTLFRKKGGEAWLVYRDANLVAAEL